MAANYINPDENGIVNYVTVNPVWILIHDGKHIIDFKESKVGTLFTKQKVYVADTETEGKAEINKLKLAPNPNIKTNG